MEAAWERNMGKKEKEMRTRSVFRYKLHDYEERERKRERDPKREELTCSADASRNSRREKDTKTE